MVSLTAGIDEFVEVPVEALEAGEQGNVAEETVTAVEGSLGLSIAVTNPEAIDGGANATVVGATEEDRARLREVVVGNAALTVVVPRSPRRRRPRP